VPKYPDGRYKGRPKNIALRRNIAALLKDGCSISEIVESLGCSNKTVITVKKEIYKP
jgi:DNA-binding NarL/FixJ family response regulator